MKRLIIWLFFLTGLSAGLVIGTIFFGWKFFLLSPLVLLFIRFTIVEEGKAKIIVRFGGVVEVFVQWSRYVLDREGNVIGPGLIRRRFFGGLKVWLGLPVDKVYKYNLRWHSVEEVEGERVPVFHEKEKKDKADFVMVRPDRYWRKTPQVETADGQFPDVEWLIGMRSRNPEKTLFKAPHDWVENALNELEPTLVAYVRTKTLNELIGLQREVIWHDIGNNRAIQIVLKDEWGIQIDQQEIGIFATTPPPGYQEALAAKARKKLESTGRAEEIIGTVITGASRAEGRPESEIQKDCYQNPKEFYRNHRVIVDNTMTKLSIEERAYLRIETPGAKGFEKVGLDLLGAWQMLLNLLGQEKEEKKEEKEEEEKELSPEAERKMKRAREALETLRKQGKRHKKK